VPKLAKSRRCRSPTPSLASGAACNPDETRFTCRPIGTRRQLIRYTRVGSERNRNKQFAPSRRLWAVQF
jgi:hypothetical protein